MESTVEKKGTSISERLLREENIRLLEETRFCIDHSYIFKCEAKAAYGVIVRWPSSDRKWASSKNNETSKNDHRTQLGYGIPMHLKKTIVSSVSNLDGKFAVEHYGIGSSTGRNVRIRAPGREQLFLLTTQRIAEVL